MEETYKARYCPYCKEHGTTQQLPKFAYPFYYFGYYGTNEDIKCEYCENIMVKMNLTNNEFNIIIKISGDSSFIDAMDELKQKDIIEFNLKMSQFKSQVSQTQQQEDNTPKCPTCGSTNIEKIGGLERAGSVYMFGIFSKKINKSFKCCNCKFTW